MPKKSPAHIASKPRNPVMENALKKVISDLKSNDSKTNICNHESDGFNKIITNFIHLNKCKLCEEYF